MSSKPSISNLKNDKNVVPNTAPIKSSPEVGEFLFQDPTNQNVNSPNCTKDVNNGRKMLLHQSLTSLASSTIQESEEEEEQDTDHNCA